MCRFIFTSESIHEHLAFSGIDEIHSIPSFAFAHDKLSRGKLQSFESGPKQRSKWVVANSRLNFSFGDFDLHPMIRKRWRQWIFTF